MGRVRTWCWVLHARADSSWLPVKCSQHPIQQLDLDISWIIRAGESLCTALWHEDFTIEDAAVMASIIYQIKAGTYAHRCSHGSV